MNNTHHHELPMPVEYLLVPNSNIKLFDGNIVMFSTRPGIQWVVHNGFYKYEDIPYRGWYFVSVVDQSILPVFEDDLNAVIKVTNTINKKFPPHCRPLPPGPGVTVFTVEDKNRLDRAFITLETLEDLNKFDVTKLPDGKIVKINDVEGESRFYTWDAEAHTWKDFDIATIEDIDDVLDEYEVKTAHVIGDGDYLTSAHLDPESGDLSFTTSSLEDDVRRIVADDPTIAKIDDIPTWSVAQ